MLAVVLNVAPIRMFYWGIEIYIVIVFCVGGHHFSIGIKNQKKCGSPKPKKQEKFNQEEFSYQDRNKNIAQTYPKDNYYEFPFLFQW